MNWMELHGEYPHDPADDYCQACGHEKDRGDCVNPDCKEQTADYCDGCGKKLLLDELVDYNEDGKTGKLCEMCNQ